MRRFGYLLLCAAALFVVSLTLRALDSPLCGRFPIGTHFLWHCLNAAVILLISHVAIRFRQGRSRYSAGHH